MSKNEETQIKLEQIQSVCEFGVQISINNRRSSAGLHEEIWTFEKLSVRHKREGKPSLYFFCLKNWLTTYHPW